MRGPQETSTGTYQQANNDEESDLPQSSTPSSLPVWWMSTEEMETCGARKAGTLDRAHYQTSFSTAAGVCSKRVSYLPRFAGVQMNLFLVLRNHLLLQSAAWSWLTAALWSKCPHVSISQTSVTRHIRWPDFQCGSLWVHAEIQP